MTALVVTATIVAGGVAAVIRWLVTLAFSHRALPWAVLIVNAAASLLGGVTLGLTDAGAIDSGIRMVLLSGLAGGLSTFSTFSVETMQLVQEGRWRVAVGSIAANLAAGLAAAGVGYAVVLLLG